MIRKAALTLALMLVPMSAMAQQKEHEHMKMDSAHMKTMDHSAMMKRHEAFVQSLIDKRAQLKLTNAQVRKLRAFKVDMAKHHEEMMKSGKMMDMKMDSAAMANDPMHKRMLAIFTPAQRTKVEAMMKEHMKTCGPDGKMQCTTDSMKMKMGH